MKFQSQLVSGWMRPVSLTLYYLSLHLALPFPLFPSAAVCLSKVYGFHLLLEVVYIYFFLLKKICIGV